MQSFVSFDILAYFDVGSGSLLVQALLGGAAGLMVFARFAWNALSKVAQARKSRESNQADKETPPAASKEMRQ